MLYNKNSIKIKTFNTGCLNAPGFTAKNGNYN